VPKQNSRRRVSVVDASQAQLGNHSVIFTDDEVIQLLKSAVEREGNQVAFARRHGVSRSNLNSTQNGKRPVTRDVLKALGLRRVYAPE
jgi:DNA-binding phage protein